MNEKARRSPEEMSQHGHGEWVQDASGLWWQLMPVGPFPEPTQLTRAQQLEAAANYIRNKLAPQFRYDAIAIQAGRYETYLQRRPDADKPGYHGEGELGDFDPATGRSSQDDWK